MRASEKVLGWSGSSQAPMGLCVWIFGPQLVELFEKDWRYGLVGGDVSLEAGFKISKEWHHSHYILCFLLEGQDVSS